MAAGGCEPVRPAEPTRRSRTVRCKCHARRMSVIPVRSLPSSEGCDWPRRTSNWYRPAGPPTASALAPSHVTALMPLSSRIRACSRPVITSDPHRPVLAAGGQPAAIWRHRHRHHPIGVRLTDQATGGRRLVRPAASPALLLVVLPPCYSVILVRSSQALVTPPTRATNTGPTRT